MKSLGLFAAVLSLVFFAACGGGGGPANIGTGAAGFSNASFKGNYVFTMYGQCASCSSGTPIMESAGVMTADGNGNITGGSWDLNVAGSLNSTPITGTYTVATDGRANLTLNETNFGGSDTFTMTLTGTTGGYIVSSDGQWALAGVVEQQSAVSSQPAGTYVFQASGVTTGLTAVGIAGSMNLTGGAVIADMNNNGSPIALGTGNVAVQTYDSTSGRGVLTITSTSSLPTMSFVFYAVNGNALELVSDDATNRMQGRAELTQGTVPSGSILSGSFAFLGAGFPPNVNGTNIQASEGGIFTGDGAGNITTGVIDTVFNASTGNTGGALTGTGSVSVQNGVTRNALATSVSGVTFSMKSPVIWLTSAGRGFFLTLDSDRVETGTINSQSGGPFTDDGTFAFHQVGWAFPSVTGGSSAAGVASAILFKNSSGTVSGFSQTLNLVGSGAGSATGTGTLSFDTTGTIGSLTLNNTVVGTQDFRFYQYSSSNAFIMEVDSGVVSSGLMTQQSSQ